ncbi:MAG: zf-HC2 domain-containing protein, partial [Planctomycetales bacterium]|nr:zf-HC2 domain-containing protein [Planctomycetales bacterium]
MIACCQFDDYLDGSLNAEDRTEFERHLAACPACAKQLRAQQTWDELVGAARLDFDVRHTGDIRVLGDRTRHDVRRVRWKRYCQVVALGVALVVGGWLTVRQVVHGPGSSSASPSNIVASDTPADIDLTGPASAATTSVIDGEAEAVPTVVIHSVDSGHVPMRLQTENSEVTIF